MIPYNKKLKPLSQRLRSKMTDAEITLWSRLRRKQIHNLQFYRQKPLGQYIVDFYCPSARLVIEVDGGQHYTDEGASLLDVLKNMDGVIATIVQYLEGKETKSP